MQHVAGRFRRRGLPVLIWGSVFWLMAASFAAAQAFDLTGTAEDRSSAKLAGAKILVLTP